LTQAADFNELLLHTLRGLVKDAHTYHKMRKRAEPEFVQLYAEDLEAKAREYSIFDLTEFYSSALFTAEFELSDDKKHIIHRFGA
jgi:hypothetical protein